MTIVSDDLTIALNLPMGTFGLTSGKWGSLKKTSAARIEGGVAV